MFLISSISFVSHIVHSAYGTNWTVFRIGREGTALTLVSRVVVAMETSVGGVLCLYSFPCPLPSSVAHPLCSAICNIRATFGLSYLLASPLLDLHSATFRIVAPSSFQFSRLSNLIGGNLTEKNEQRADIKLNWVENTQAARVYRSFSLSLKNI